MVFAKKPVAGRVKTRLTSHCSPGQAANLAAGLIELSISRFVRFWPGSVELCCWPDCEDGRLLSVARRFRVALSCQSMGSLGFKMGAAMDRGLQGHRAVAVIGSDIPHCAPATLRQIYRTLLAGLPVLAPSRDGGFYLIGCDRLIGGIMDDIQWSRGDVFATTQAILEKHYGEVATNFSTLEDIDYWDDALAVAESDREVADLMAGLDRDNSSSFDAHSPS